MNPNRKKTSEVLQKEQTSEEKAVKMETATLEEYISEANVHRGLVASFRYEASKDASLLEPKTREEWDIAFTAQSNKVY